LGAKSSLHKDTPEEVLFAMIRAVFAGAPAMPNRAGPTP